MYFQNNPLSGVFILAGIFVQSTRVAVHGIIAIVAGNLAGILMGFDKSFLSCGLFGYNSFLVGLALATFYSPEKHEGYYWPVGVGAIIFAYFSRWVMKHDVFVAERINQYEHILTSFIFHKNQTKVCYSSC